MAVDKPPKLTKKGDHLPHYTEPDMKEQYTNLVNDVTLDKVGGLKHKDTKTKKLPSDLI